MPEVVDNVKVGQFIKDQLKENKISQDALAQKLNITKTAVSQNLNGKSSFSRKNLNVIAELLNMKVEDILNCKRSDAEEFDSPYQALARRGLADFKRNYSRETVIEEPDIFGRVLVDYLIDEDVLEIFSYLHELEALFVRDHFHRAKDIYLKLIEYCLKNDLPGTIRYIKAYSDLNNCFDISLYNNAKTIWDMINKETNKYLIEEMMELKIIQEYKVIFFNMKRPVKAITKQLWLDTIARYKLNHVLNVYLEFYAMEEDFLSFVKVMFNEQFPKGIELFMKKFFKEELPDNKRATFNFQKAILIVMDNDHLNLFKKMIGLRVYESLTDVISKGIMSEKKSYYEYCLKLEEVKKDIDYERVGQIAVKHKDLSVLDMVVGKLHEKELNFLLSEVLDEDAETMEYLVKHGAKFDFDYYNSHTMKNINQLIEYLSKEEVSK
jgi:transcriptional regulator with XRE-family HTH domain